MKNRTPHAAFLAGLLLLASGLPVVAQHHPHPGPLQPSYSVSSYSQTLLTNYNYATVVYLKVDNNQNYLVSAKASVVNVDGDAQWADCRLVASNSPGTVVLDKTDIRLQSFGDANNQAIALQGSLCVAAAGQTFLDWPTAIDLQCKTYNGKVTDAVITATGVPTIAVTGSSQPAPPGTFDSCIHQSVPMISTGLSPQNQNGSPDPYHSTVTVVGSGFQPGATLQIVFRNLPDVVPEVCMVCSALYSHLQDVPAPTPAQVGADGTFQVAQVVPHNVEGGSASGPVTILVRSTGNTPGIAEALGTADASYWIGPMPADN